MSIAFLLPFCAAILWGIHFNLIESGFEKFSIATYMFLAGIMSIAISLVIHFSRKGHIDFSSISSYKVFTIILVICLVAKLADLSTLYAVKNLNASYAAIGECIYPIFVPIVAYIIWQKVDFTTLQFVGSFIVILGISMVIYGQKVGMSNAVQVANKKKVIVKLRKKDFPKNDINIGQIKTGNTFKKLKDPPKKI